MVERISECTVCMREHGERGPTVEQYVQNDVLSFHLQIMFGSKRERDERMLWLMRREDVAQFTRPRCKGSPSAGIKPWIKKRRALWKHVSDAIRCLAGHKCDGSGALSKESRIWPDILMDALNLLDADTAEKRR